MDDYNYKDTYIAYYNFNISSINGQDMWYGVDIEEMLPLNYKRGPGRSKKLRRREPDKDPNKRNTWKIYCWIRCGIHGHSAKSCSCLVVDPKAKKRKV